MPIYRHARTPERISEGCLVPFNHTSSTNARFRLRTKHFLADAPARDEPRRSAWNRLSKGSAGTATAGVDTTDSSSTRLRHPGKRTGGEQLAQVGVELLRRRRRDGKRGGLQRHVQRVADGGLDAARQALQLAVERLEQRRLPRVGRRLQLMPELAHLQPHPALNTFERVLRGAGGLKRRARRCSCKYAAQPGRLQHIGFTRHPMHARSCSPAATRSAGNP